MNKENIHAFSDVDASDNAGQWLKLMQDFAKLPEVTEIRNLLISWMRRGNPETILDAGCGLGDSTRQIAEEIPTAKNIIGMDFSQEMLNYAKKQENPPTISYEQGDITQLKYPDASFDCVRIERVLHHVMDVEAALSEIYRVLKPGGHFVIIEPDFYSVKFFPFPNELSHKLNKRVRNNAISGDVGSYLHALAFKQNFKLVDRRCIGMIWSNYQEVKDCGIAIDHAIEVLNEAGHQQGLADLETAIQDGSFYFTIPGYVYAFEKRS